METACTVYICFILFSYIDQLSEYPTGQTFRPSSRFPYHCRQSSAPLIVVVAAVAAAGIGSRCIPPDIPPP
jgi:hypothetical protein